MGENQRLAAASSALGHRAGATACRMRSGGVHMVADATTLDSRSFDRGRDPCHDRCASMRKIVAFGVFVASCVAAYLAYQNAQINAEAKKLSRTAVCDKFGFCHDFECVAASCAEHSAVNRRISVDEVARVHRLLAFGLNT